MAVGQEGDHMKQPIYRRQPAMLDWYFRRIRDTPNTWLTTPWAILVPPALWDSGEWKQGRFQCVRIHEEMHFAEASIWWMIRYLTSQRFKYAVELRALRAEISLMAGAQKVAFAEWAAWTLDVDYGITFKTRNEMVADLLA
jgi:hypothetical protein